MQPMVSMSAQPPTTTGASDSTSHPRNASVSPTRGAYPTHCQIPVTLQHDLSIAAAADIIQSLGGTVPTTTTAKIKHVRAIQKMTAIMAGQQAPAMPPAQRVVEPTSRMATTSNNIMAPNIIRNMPS
jgi:hypothetical protein